MLRCALFASLALAAALPAAAQPIRNFPATALRGEVVFVAPPELTLNGRPARLAPGARIRGEDNLLQAPGALAGQKRTVHYTLEASTGMLMDVWLLRADEIANKPWPTTPAQAQSWSFDWGGQKWTRK
jgi:hypothetical protein